MSFNFLFGYYFERNMLTTFILAFQDSSYFCTFDAQTKNGTKLNLWWTPIIKCSVVKSGRAGSPTLEYSIRFIGGLVDSNSIRFGVIFVLRNYKSYIELQFLICEIKTHNWYGPHQ